MEEMLALSKETLERKGKQVNERAKTAREMNGGSRGGVVPSH